MHYNGANRYLFANGTEIYKLKAKDSELVPIPLCLGNILKDWSVDIHGFSVDYDAITVDYIKDIHKYLMEKIT